MRFTAYYLISPKNALVQEFTLYPSIVADVFMQPVLWTKQEGGKTLKTEKDTALQVKLLFLAYVIETYDHIDVQSFLKKVLGNPPYSTEVFDVWWDVKNLSVEKSFEDVEKAIRNDLVASLAKTGNLLVDNWLDELRKSTRQ